jgi:hypothetical protein
MAVVKVLQGRSVAGLPRYSPSACITGASAG